MQATILTRSRVISSGGSPARFAQPLNIWSGRIPATRWKSRVTLASALPGTAGCARCGRIVRIWPSKELRMTAGDTCDLGIGLSTAYHQTCPISGWLMLARNQRRKASTSVRCAWYNDIAWCLQSRSSGQQSMQNRLKHLHRSNCEPVRATELDCRAEKLLLWEILQLMQR